MIHMVKSLQKFGVLLQKQINEIQERNTETLLKKADPADQELKKLLPGLEKSYRMLVGYVMLVEAEDED